MRLGWWLGGMGSLLWLFLLSGVWLVQGDRVGGGVGLALGLAGVAWLARFAPWRFPRTPIRNLYGGFVGILLTGALVALWRSSDTLASREATPLVVLGTLFLPMIPLGRRTWDDLRRGQVSSSPGGPEG